MIRDGLWDAFNDFHMGQTAELVAEKYKITREEQDRYALESHQKAVHAMQSCYLPVADRARRSPAEKGRANRNQKRRIATPR